MDELIHLVKKAKEGDRAAFETLYHKTSKRIYSYIYYMIQDDALAADTTQETYLRAFKNIKKLEENAKFFSWLRTIAVNLTRDYIRVKPELPSSLEEYMEAGEKPQVHDEKSPDPLARLEQKEVQRAVQNAMMRLSEEHREVLLLHYFEDMPLEEISQMLSVKIGTLKSRLARARERLAEILRDKL